MRIDIFTLFPEMFVNYFGTSILKRAQTEGLLKVYVHDIRHHATGNHRVTDEPPYGGGGGMVLKPEPIFAAVESILGHNVRGQRHIEEDTNHENPQADRCPIILLTPQGRAFTQQVAQEYAEFKRLALVCGRYEGVDERIREHLVTDEISIGDYVITGGELAAMVVVDAVARLIPGVLGSENAAVYDSHSTGLLEGPHYTRPDIFRDREVPEILLSGHTSKIQRWRREQAVRRTWQRRPEMLIDAELNEEDRWFLATLAAE